MTGGTYSRRRLLASLVAVGGIAGCQGGEESDDGGDSTATPTAVEEAGSNTESTSDNSNADESTPKLDDLDAREANVLEVTVERSDTEVRFDVTLYHDDDGESGYANWWQVETRDGRRLGRRDLAHAHGTRPFTRSTSVSVPDDVDCVVVRGHDQEHGYGGRALLVDVDSGATAAIEQGEEPAEPVEASYP